MQDLGGNRAEEQAAQGAVAAGGHDQKIGSVVFDKVVDYVGWLALPDDLLVGFTGQIICGEVAQFCFVGGLDVGRNQYVEGTQISVKGDRHLVGMEKGDGAVVEVRELDD